MTTWEYLAGDETIERRELKWGTLVREVCRVRRV